MKIAKYWILSIVTGMFVACEMSNPDVQYTITQCTSIPSPRASATSFVIDNYAYVFGGRDSEGNYLNDLWKYDPQKDIWESLGITPLQSRVNATSCVCDGVAYIGLGFNGLYYNSTGYLTDWWSYDPINNQWKQLSNFPGNTTDRAISMVGDGELYIGYGFCYTYERDMYRYEIMSDTWEFIDVHLDRNPLTFPVRSFGGIGASCQGRYFAGTGFRTHSLNWWGEFLPEGKWLKRKSVPGHKRTIATCTATETYIYIIGGIHWGGINTTGEILNDIQQYNPLTNNWVHVGNLPNRGFMNHIAFSVDKRVFVGLGENENMQVCDDLYCIYEK